MITFLLLEISGYFSDFQFDLKSSHLNTRFWQSQFIEFLWFGNIFCATIDVAHDINKAFDRVLQICFIYERFSKYPVQFKYRILFFSPCLTKRQLQVFMKKASRLPLLQNNSLNVSCKGQVKNFLILYKVYAPFSRYSSFRIFNIP